MRKDIIEEKDTVIVDETEVKNQYLKSRSHVFSVGKIDVVFIKEKLGD